MTKAQSIQPLHGGNRGHIETLEVIRQHVDSTPALTVEDLKSWYSNQYKTTSKVSKPYIDSLFSSGLLWMRDGRIECTFPEGKHRDRRVIEIIDENVVYVLEMLRDVRDGKKQKQLHKLGRKCGLTGDLKNGVQKRRGWLQSARFLERRDGKLYATPRGKELIRKHFPESVDDARDDAKENPEEFGGRGEGQMHKTLKEYIHGVAASKDTVEGSEKEYSLPSSDKVDVTAWNTKAIWHIEVKSHISQDPDVKRGIYQCVKYAAVGKAFEKAKDSRRSVKSLLVVESKPSPTVRKLADKLGICVYPLPAPMKRELKKLRADSG